MKKRFLFIPLLLISQSGIAQLSNGKVSSLVAAENYFAGIAREKGIRKAFLTVSNEETILFRPDPVKALSYFDKKSSNDGGQLAWEPVLARISRSGDWGFTTGPYTYRPQSDSTRTYYGQYLSVWKMNNKGVWKLALDLGIDHNKPLAKPKLIFTDAPGTRFFRQRSEARLRQREELILTSDQLFAKTLQKYKNLAYNIFLSDEARLLFPGYEPVIGKSAITDFLRLNELNVNTEPVKAERAPGSDLAYSYGTASITRKGVAKTYNYVRIWEAQDGHKWNVIVELFTPAAKTEDEKPKTED